MNLLRLRQSQSAASSLEEGTPDEVVEKKRRALAEVLRPQRLDVARRIATWTEIENDFA